MNPCTRCGKRVFGTGDVCRRCERIERFGAGVSRGWAAPDSHLKTTGLDEEDEVADFNEVRETSSRVAVETVLSDDEMSVVNNGNNDDRISLFGDRDESDDGSGSDGDSESGSNRPDVETVLSGDDMSVDETDEEGISMFGDGDDSDNGSAGVMPMVCCENCHLEGTRVCNGLPSGQCNALCRDVYCVQLESIRFSIRKWKTVKNKQYYRRQGRSSLYLCSDCYWLLCVSDTKERKGKHRDRTWSHVWKVFFWMFLSSTIVHGKFGRHAWKYIPETIRPLWKNVLVREFPDVYSNLDDVLSCYDDATEEMARFEKVHKELKLGDIVAAYSGLMPGVLCPWGCSEYVFDCGEVRFEHVFNELVYRGPWTLLEGTEDDRPMSFRRDFLDGETCMHLFNEEWKVRPSMIFVRRKGPCFLTCKCHDGGTKDRYFHLPRSPAPLVSSYGDQLGHVTLRSNVVGTAKAHKYSHEYQINNCRGSYNGIDTCRITEERRFDFQSHSAEMLESVFVRERPDTKGLLSELVKAGKVHRDALPVMEEKSDKYFGCKSGMLERCKVGSTFMTLLDTVKLHRTRQDINRRHVLVHDEAGGSSLLEVEMKWPSVLVGIHEYDKFGCMPERVHKRDNGGVVDNRLVFTLEAMLRCVPLMWETTCSAVKDNNEWHGHLLFRQKVGGKKWKYKKDYPFGSLPFGLKEDKQMCEAEKVMRLLELSTDYSRRMRDHRYRGVSNFIGGFRASQVRALLCDEKYDETCSFLAAPRSRSRLVRDIIGVPEAKQMIVLYRVQGARPATYDLPIKVSGMGSLGNDSFDLVFVSRSDLLDTATVKWEAEVYSRHGGMFDGFWAQTTKEKRCYRVEDSGVIEKLRGFDIAIYVRSCAKSVDEIRREYFAYIGGQNKCVCKEHMMPLIVCERTKAKRCGMKDGTDTSQSSCHRQCSFCCPVNGCSVAMCHACFKDVSDDAVLLVSPVGQGSDGIQPRDTERMRDENEMSENEETSANEDGESVHTRDSVSSGGSVSLPNGGEIFAEDLESDAEKEDEGETNVPTTIYGNRETMFAGCGSSGGRNIRGSVLLNQFGSCLVRPESQLSGTRNERNLLQRLTLRDVGHTVAVAYPEAMMFPSIFWAPFGEGAEGSFLGSIPIALLCRDATRKDTRMAPIIDHVKTRLTSPLSNAGSHADYCSFLFDTLANSTLCGQDSRVVLRRGFAECMTTAGVRAKKREENFFTDSIDNREVVHELCAAQRESKFTLFVTLTCNQSRHFGVKHIKQWIDAEEMGLACYDKWYTRNFPGCRTLDVYDRQDILKSLREHGRILLLRNWMQVRKILRKYICESDEKPLGKVVLFFGRDEYQEEKGNLFHVHWLVGTEDDYSTEEGREKLQKLIRGFSQQIILQEEIQDFVDRGLLKNAGQASAVRECALVVLKHDCSSVRHQLQTGEDDRNTKCRCLHGERLNKFQTQFYEHVVDPKHTPEAMEVLDWCELIKPLLETDGAFEPIVEELICKRIIPACRREEGCISPVVADFFVVAFSSHNVQAMTCYSMARYVAKYVAAVDQNNLIIFHADNNRRKSNAVRMEHVVQKNTKVTTSRINQEKRMSARRDAMHPTGRLICSFEQLQICLQDPQIQTNYETIKVSTTPLGERAGVARKKKVKPEHEGKSIYCPDLDQEYLSVVHYRDENFASSSSYRVHTKSQKLMLRDQLHSTVILDKVTLFGCRPPELLVLVQNPMMYWRWFLRSKRTEKGSDLALGLYLHANLQNSCLLDGLNHRVYIRRTAIAEIWQHLRSIKTEMEERGHMPVYKWLRHFFELFYRANLNRDSLSQGELRLFNQMESNLICEENEHTSERIYRFPVMVHSNVKPTNPHRFLVHLLLCYGWFETELDLFIYPTIRECFQAARLIAPTATSADLNEQVRLLLRRWIMDQLVYYPITTKAFDRYLVQANRVLKEAIIEGVVDVGEMPPALYTALVAGTETKACQWVAECQRTLLKVTHDKLAPVFQSTGDYLPPIDDVLQGRATQWEGKLSRTEGQSIESETEQTAARESVYSAIDDYLHMRTSAIKSNRGIVGAPGGGKTFCMQMGIMYGLCRMLISTTTAILAERALLLGGQHIHRLIRLPVKPRYSVHRLAELAVINLLKNPDAMEFLCKLDVIYMDEMGQISAELLSIIDIIMRKVRGSSLFMGGILVVGTIDHLQLLPIDGLPFLISPLVPFSFKFYKLCHSVRGSSDPAMIRVVEITRYVSDRFTPQVANELRRLLQENCVFVDSWDHPAITDDTLRVFSRHPPADTETRRFLSMKEVDLRARGERWVKARAEDSMIAIESHGEWHKASQWVSNVLNRKTSEPEELMLFQGGFYEFTYNSIGHFSATQLALLLDVPTTESISKFEEISIWVAPAGTREVALPDCYPATLLSRGWKLEKVGMAPEYERTDYARKTRMKRKQYGLKHHISSTIHAAVGHTVPKIAGCLDNPDSRLWERAQAVVFLTRTGRLADIIFVGDKAKNIQAIITALRLKDQWTDYMTCMVDVLSGAQESPRVVEQGLLHPFRPRDVVLPKKGVGVVYMLRSGKNPRNTYVGQSANLKERVRQHNRPGGGSFGTSHAHGKPWLLFGYVAGFRTTDSRLDFERRLQNLRNRRFQRSQTRDAQLLVDMAEEIAHSWVRDPLYVTSFLTDT